MVINMNILVVDDEYYIVQGILKNTNWAKLGIDSIYTAYSMKQAQEIFLQHEIDILLADISMPKGNGLDLITWVNENSYTPVKMLLTGHQNFSYAQTAIHLQCFQYILKPISSSALEAELLLAVEKANENKNLDRVRDIADSWDSTKSMRMESFWRNLYSGDTATDIDHLTESMEKLGVPSSWMEDDFYFLLFHIHPKNISSDSSLQLASTDIYPVISGILHDIDYTLFRVNNYDFILAQKANYFNDYQNLFDTCEDIISQLTADFPEYRFSIYLSDKTPITAAAECYQQLKKFEEGIFTTDNIVIPVHSLHKTQTNEFLDPYLQHIPFTEWSALLLQYRSHTILKEITSFFKNESSYYSVKVLIAMYYGILQTVFSVLESKEISMSELFPKLVHHSDLVNATSSIENFLYWTNRLLYDAEEILKVNSDSANFVDTVKKFIKAHLDSEKLDRNYIAEEIHMNPDYLSYLFHKQSGQLLSSYIINERITAAKKMLLTSTASLQEIADATGFSNSSYFSKQFKKIVQMTPQQYRNSSATDLSEQKV
ncbi:MAG: helix-turn-helix domain-containing protein [Mobilitalea sp.]